MLIFTLFVLCSASVVQSKNVAIENLQSLILETINESASDFEPCNQNLLSKAVFGDMIEIKRHSYFHWSVFVEETTFIQLDNPEFDRLTVQNAFDNFTGEVQLRNLIELAKNDYCRINNKISESKRKGLRVFLNAEMLEKMKKEYKHRSTYYNVFDYNCEHFAAKLKFGVSFSSQIEAVAKIAGKEEYKEIVAEMFKMAANPSQWKATSEIVADIFRVVV